MPVIDVPQPEFMEDEEIAIYKDAVGKFFDQHAPQKRVETWRENGQVDREFWNEAGAAATASPRPARRAARLQFSPWGVCSARPSSAFITEIPSAHSSFDREPSNQFQA